MFPCYGLGTKENETLSHYHFQDVTNDWIFKTLWVEARHSKLRVAFPLLFSSNFILV